MITNKLIIGEPGSGKSFGTALLALKFPGAVFSGDPHKESLTALLLDHLEGDVLYHQISNLDHSLGYGLLRPSVNSDPGKRLQENRRRAKQFVEVMMRRRGGGIASAPLMEEWVMALLMIYLYQRPVKDPSIIPFGFRPGTDEFAALLRDCPLRDLKHKFEALEAMKPAGLRSEVGSAARLVSGTFGDPEFLAACRPGFDLGAFLQNGGKLLLERGTADEDVTRTIIGGINLLITEHCENRPKPYPPVAILLDECTNANTAGDFEERKAGETRKFGLHWHFICQHPNFPNGPEGFFQNCQEKHFYRTGDYTLAHKLAAFVAAGMSRGEKQSRAEMIDGITSELMGFKPGWRYVVGPGGTRKEYVPMLVNPWPDWPGLRQAKREEKLCRIYSRPEYRKTPVPRPSGDSGATSESSSPDDTASLPSSLPDSTSPAERWKRGRKKPAGG